MQDEEAGMVANVNTSVSAFCLFTLIDNFNKEQITLLSHC